VYGQFAVGDEQEPREPYSPYGVTKLAAENLVLAHARNFGLDVTVLRYFSLYGPRQRPDMGYHIFCETLLDGRAVTIFGDGRQTRSNTHVADAVSATVAALRVPTSGEVMNVAGGQTIELLEAVHVLADELGVRPEIRFASPRPGDQRATAGDSSKARDLLQWTPSVDIIEGLQGQARWHRERRGTPLA
jgi:nucleoside-diphosphate-sugar epimerase